MHTMSMKVQLVQAGFQMSIKKHLPRWPAQYQSENLLKVWNFPFFKPEL